MSEHRSLLDMIEGAIADGAVTLPARNQTAQQLQGILGNADFDIQEVLDIIEVDQALTAEVLRVSNSSFYGGLTEVTTVRGAVVRIGGPEVVRLALAATEKGSYRVRDPHLGQLMQPLWDHAMGSAMGARWIARRLGYRDLESESFIAGLLHDVGKLLLIRVIDDLKQAGQLTGAVPESVIREVLDTAHAEYGANLLTHWSLPDVYQTVVRDHHREPCDVQNPLLLMVRLANKACLSLGIGLAHDPSLTLAATEEAHALDARDIMLAELAIMLEDSFSLAP
jgi:HD-like signal output (HDOD) protein